MKRSKAHWWTLLLLCLMIISTLSPLGAADIDIPKPSNRDKCPVCGMFVFKYPDWLAAMRFKDGTYAYFDGVKDMFKFLHDPQKYGSPRTPQEIQVIAVMDYYQVTWIDAHKAWYVLGSDIYGPMGRELIPHATEADAKEFMKDHQGKRIIQFPEVTPEVIGTLD